VNYNKLIFERVLQTRWLKTSEIYAILNDINLLFEMGYSVQ